MIALKTIHNCDNEDDTARALRIILSKPNSPDQISSGPDITRTISYVKGDSVSESETETQGRHYIILLD